MSDGYSRDRDGFSNHERGRIFENGTDRFFGDRENGYTHGSRKYEFRDERGRIERIEFDKIKNERDRSLAASIEEKSGRIEGRKDEKQLRGVRVLLEKGEISRHTLRSVEGEEISKECRELIDGLKRDFPERFTHLEISRADAREIWAKGLAIERGLGQQLELDKVREKARAGKAQSLQKARGKQIALAKAREAREKFRAIETFREAAARGRQEAPGIVHAERARVAEARAAREKERGVERNARDPLEVKKAALAKAIEDQARAINQARDKGQAPQVEQLRESHADMSKSLNEIREIEQARVRDALIGAGHTPERAKELAPMLAQAHEAERRDIVIGIDTVGAIVERDDKARAEREAANKARDEPAPARESEKARPQETERERQLREAREALTQQVEARRAELTKQGVPLEVQKLLALGQIPPSAEEIERRRSLPHPHSQGRSRDLSRGQDRGRER